MSKVIAVDNTTGEGAEIEVAEELVNIHVVYPDPTPNYGFTVSRVQARALQLALDIALGQITQPKDA